MPAEFPEGKSDEGSQDERKRQRVNISDIIKSDVVIRFVYYTISSEISSASSPGFSMETPPIRHASA